MVGLWTVIKRTHIIKISIIKIINIIIIQYLSSAIGKEKKNEWWDKKDKQKT